MKKAYQKQNPRRTKKSRVRFRTAGPEDAVQLTLDRSEVLREMQEGLHRLGVTLGLELAALMMKDEVPIYPVSTSSRALTGGIRAAWEQGKKWQFGVFVGSKFSLFP